MTINHLGIFVSDLEASRIFYQGALKPLGYKITVKQDNGNVLGFSADKIVGAPNFFISGPESSAAKATAEREGMKGGQANSGPLHLAFTAKDREVVRRFHEGAIAAGGKDNGKPGPRPQYGPTYYGAFAFDPDGRNIEAVCVKPSFLAEPMGAVGWVVTSTVVAGVGYRIAKWMEIM